MDTPRTNKLKYEFYMKKREQALRVLELRYREMIRMKRAIGNRI